MKINCYKSRVVYLLCVGVLCLFFGSTARGQWVQTNGPYGGKVLCFGVSGTSLFAGTISGGIYRSTNEGDTWSAVNTGLPKSILVECIVVNGSAVFIGTWGGVVYRSLNQGDTWTAVNTILPDRDINCMAVNDSALFVGTGNGVVFRSKDEGATWYDVNIGLTDKRIECLTVSGSTLFAGTWGDDGVYRSTDEGNSWIAINKGITGGLVRCLAINNSTLFAGTDNGVYRSTDEGNTWVAVNTGLSNSTVLYLTVSGVTLFAGTDDGIYRSTNEGNTWSVVNTGLTNRVLRCLAVNGPTLFAGTNNGGGVYRSTDEGNTWITINTGFSDTTVECLAVNGSTLFAGTWDGNDVYRSTDEGDTWTAVNTEFAGGRVDCIEVNGSTLFAGIDGRVYRSTDEGDTWIKVNTGLTLANTNCLAVNDSTLFIGTYYGEVYRTTDDGATWIEVNKGLTVRYIECLTVNGMTLFAGTDGGVYRSTNEGNTWSAVNTGLPNSISVECIAVKGSKLFAGTYGGGVYLSTNKGDSWIAVNTGLTNSIIKCIAVNGTTLFAGTPYAGVYCSTDDGSTWTQVNNNVGFPSSEVRSLVVNGSTLLAGTWGSGVWKYDISSINRLSAIALPDNVSICQQSDTILSIKTTGGTQPYSYLWSYTDGSTIPSSEILIGGTSIDSSMRLAPTATRDYRCIVTDSLSAKDTVTFTVTVLPKPTPAITQNGNELQSDTADSYQWLDNTHTPISGATSQTYTPSTSGAYYVLVTKNGCAGESIGFAFANSSQNGCITILDVDAGDWIYSYPEGKPFLVQINNTSNQKCTVNKLDINNPNFHVVGGQFPIEIAAGDTELIAMRYVPTGFGSESGTICAQTSCNNCNVCGKVTGRGIDTIPNAIVTTLILHPSKDSVSVGEEFTVYLALENQNPRLPSKTYDWIGQFQYDGRVLYDRDLLPNKDHKIPRIVVNPMIGYWNNEETGDTLYRKSFLVKLADIDSIVLSFKKFNAHEGFEWIYTNDTDIKFVYRLIDSVVYIRVCKDDGKQYIRFASADDIKNIVPNPSTGSSIITLSIGIEGECTVSLVDIFGRVIQEVHYDKLSKGEHNMKFDESNLETGAYYVVMRTGFNVASQKVSVVR